jgi:hypothetical protein
VWSTSESGAKRTSWPVWPVCFGRHGEHTASALVSAECPLVRLKYSRFSATGAGDRLRSALCGVGRSQNSLLMILNPRSWVILLVEMAKKTAPVACETDRAGVLDALPGAAAESEEP